MWTAFRAAMSMPSSIVGEQKGAGRNRLASPASRICFSFAASPLRSRTPKRKRFSRSSRLSGSTWAVCSRASNPKSGCIGARSILARFS